MLCGKLTIAANLSWMKATGVALSATNVNNKGGGII